MGDRGKSIFLFNADRIRLFLLGPQNTKYHGWRFLGEGANHPVSNISSITFRGIFLSVYCRWLLLSEIALYKYIIQITFERFDQNIYYTAVA